ncbi:putative membrane protein [Robbsia andropogonis]|uniref:hypothetical protein n=1 Tax=Robbsia andropogonis TaxID=28092 RepID=UPI003D204630
MPDFSDLLNLKGLLTGLFTVTATVALTIKSLSVTWNVNKDNVTIQGNNNTVIQNSFSARVQQDFHYIWNALVAAIFFAYPLSGSSFNAVLSLLACLGVPVSIAALIVNCRRSGRQRMGDVFYVIGAAIVCWLASCASPFLTFTANQAEPLYSQIFDAITAVSSGNYPWPTVVFSLSQTIAWPILSMIGFALFFSSLLYLMFAYFSHRNAQNAFKFSKMHVGMALMGYFLACNVVEAMFKQRFDYMKAVGWALIGPFFS